MVGAGEGSWMSFGTYLHSSSRSIVISGVDGTPSDQSFAAVPLVETQALVEVCSEQGRIVPLGGGVSMLEALRNMVKFLAKVRADLVRFISCGLGLYIKASRDIRMRPKVGRKLKLFSACGPSLRPGPLEADIRVRASSSFASRHGEASSEKAQEVILGVCLDV